MTEKSAQRLAMVSAVLFACPAQAADLGTAQAFPAPLYNWSGFYVGANVGGAFSPETESTQLLGPFATDPSGVIGGVQLGYNVLLGSNWLLGVENEFDWTSAQGNVIIPNPIAAATITSKHNWYDTLSGRLGLVQGPWLFYAKAGGAWLDATYQFTGNNSIGVTTGDSVSNTRTGWLAGAGVEYLFSSGWSAKIEYDYLDFGNQNLTFGNLGISAGVSTQIQQVKVGVNYHWLPGALFGLF